MNLPSQSPPEATPDPVSSDRSLHILLPIFEPEDIDPLVPIAQTVARRIGAELTLLHVLPVPEGESLTMGTGTAIHRRERLEELLTEHGLDSSRVHPLVRVAHEVWDGIWETVEEEGGHILLVPWGSHRTEEMGALLDGEMASPPCHVILARPAEGLGSPEAWKGEHILLPLRSSPHARLALRLAELLARALEMDITALHVRDREGAGELRAPYLLSSGQVDALARSVLAVGEAPARILEEAEGHRLIVLGAPTRPLPADGGWDGTMLDAVADSTDTSLLVVKRRRLEPAEPVPARVPLTHVVDKWFAENTFHSREFSEIERLVELKEEQGVTISLGLPALNEEETVGKVIRVCRQHLMEEFPLLDEVVLIDSDSTDRTREIAEDLGVPVHVHQQTLTEHGSVTGKGEALWKSLYVLEGDVIAWIDTDIKNIHQRFVYGILGPLLREPRIQYVKGFYRRPLKQGEKIVAGGGGRVTELTARPLINLFFPELSGVIQPLAGEYAGRRSALEQVPFFTGYGVETGLLIDLLNEFGLSAIAQSDLLQRVHHNQPLRSLSKMAFAIIQVVVSRLERSRDLRLLEEVEKTMNLIRYEEDGYHLETQEIRERERPPMIEIPEYRAKRGLPPLAQAREEEGG